MTIQEWYWRWRLWYAQKKVYYKLVLRYRKSVWWVRLCNWLDRPFTGR